MRQFSFRAEKFPISLTVDYEGQVLHRIGLKQVSAAAKRNSQNTPRQNSSFERKLIKDFNDYFSGRKVGFNYRLSTGNLTKFQRKVLEALKKIPRGRVESYGSIAKTIGLPTAARAVGSACGKNPFSIIIPCHRVIRSDGKLGGFGCGTKIKKMLLRLEGAEY